MAAFAIGILLFVGVARATGPDAASNPYSVIFQRSVFGLVPPPPPPPPSADVSAAVPPPDIALNGIMSVFGRRYALFKLPANKGKSYLLGEGQGDGEIQLLSVDERAGKIKISNHGIVQTISLAKPPATTGQPAAGGAPNAAPNAAPLVVAGNNPRQSPAEGIAPAAFENNPMPVAMPVAMTGLYAGAGGGNSGNSQGGSSGGTPSSSGDSGSQSSGGSSSAPRPEPVPWWVTGSKNLEAARIATANLVSSGQAEPWPLTPFTPPGTPANLIGPERLYFGHGVYQGVDSGDRIPD